MKAKLFATLCLVSLLVIAISKDAFAQTTTVGVSPGNIFYYNYNLLWDSTDPTATTPAEYIELNKTQLIQIGIKSVSGSLINMDMTAHFLIIRANANQNEKIYPSGGHSTITETIPRTYPNGTRQTNHYISESTTTDTYEKTEIYFDRITGVATEYYYELRETSNSYVTTTKETAILDSSILWIIPEFPAYAILLILAFTSLAIALYVKKLRASGTDKGRAVLSCTHHVHSRTRDASTIALPS
jgi:hypothetical protein